MTQTTRRAPVSIRGSLPLAPILFVLELCFVERSHEIALSSENGVIARARVSREIRIGGVSAQDQA